MHRWHFIFSLTTDPRTSCWILSELKDDHPNSAIILGFTKPTELRAVSHLPAHALLAEKDFSRLFRHTQPQDLSYRLEWLCPHG
jgi:hypothetical protein